ncbi:MAG: energy transducer TonB [Acidobacteriia bacterium]|nr:energy transducer TonB [Terriglobia bacterium]
MCRLVTAVLLGFPLLAAVVSAQDNPSSPTPNSGPSAPASAAQAQVTPASNPPGSRAVPPGLAKVCSDKNPPPCATPPRTIKAPNPKYSKEARKKKIAGLVVLWLVVDANGLPRDIRVARSIGYGLDEEAIKAAKKWRFKPSTLNGQPVPVQINVEVTFKLY